MTSFRRVPVLDPFAKVSALRASSVQRVLSIVEMIPRGKVMAYGDIAALLGIGPREVARIMATQGDEVPWWRVLRSNGTCAPHLEEKQLDLLSTEKVTFCSPTRVNMAVSRVIDPEM